MCIIAINDAYAFDLGGGEFVSGVDDVDVGDRFYVCGNGVDNIFL